MNLELLPVEWSQIANRRLLIQHEKAASKKGLSVEQTCVVARLDLDDEEWEDFTTNLTSFRLWLEGQGGNGIQDEIEYRKAVKVSGPDRTIYIDPQGGAHAQFVGFPQEEPCPVKTPASPAKNSKAAASGGKATQRSTRSRKASSAHSAAKSGASSPTPAPAAAAVAGTTATEPAVPAEAATAPAVLPVSKPRSRQSPLTEQPEVSAPAVAAAPKADPSVVKDLFELIDDDSTDEDW